MPESDDIAYIERILFLGEHSIIEGDFGFDESLFQGELKENSFKMSGVSCAGRTPKL